MRGSLRRSLLVMVASAWERGMTWEAPGTTDSSIARAVV